jgi:peroxiredoxin
MTRYVLIIIVLAATLALPTLILLSAHRFAGDAAGLRLGDDIPVAQLRSLDGRFVDTRSWSGRQTLLVVFLSTCRACESEIQGLEKVARSLPELRVVLLAVDSAAPRLPTAFLVLSDPSGQFVRRVRRLIVPTLYVADARGKVVYVRSGQRDPDFELQILRELLKRKSEESSESGYGE